MFNNPYGAAMGSDNGAFMRMLPMLFQGMRGFTGQQPQFSGNQSQPQQQQPQQQGQQPQNMFSGINKVLDPNSNFMSSLMKSLGGGGYNSTGGQRTGAPIANTPSTNMQNNPFMQMPWANGGMKQGQ